jgi:hypothetical protein
VVVLHEFLVYPELGEQIPPIDLLEKPAIVAVDDRLEQDWSLES